VKNRFLSLSFLLLVAAVLAPASRLRAEPGHQFPPVPPEGIRKILDAAPAKATAQPAKPRKLLVFYRTEGFVHPSIPYGIEALIVLGKKTGAFEAVASEDMAMFTPEKLAEFDGVMFLNTTGLKFEDPAQRKALLDFIASGKGMMGIHAATDNFPTWPEAQEMMGGKFNGHPWGAGDTVAVKIDDPKHPVAQAFGGKGFWIKDEIYQITGPFSRDKQRVLLSLDMSKPQNARPANVIVRVDNDFPIAWIKKLSGGGRVFYSSLGHNEAIYQTPEVLRHYLDGIQFALGDLPADAVPSAKLAPKPQPALAPTEPKAN
jgi:type 1 glutamine amidotransferase